MYLLYTYTELMVGEGHQWRLLWSRHWTKLYVELSFLRISNRLSSRRNLTPSWASVNGNLYLAVVLNDRIYTYPAAQWTELLTALCVSLNSHLTVSFQRQLLFFRKLLNILPSLSRQLTRKMAVPGIHFAPPSNILAYGHSTNRSSAHFGKSGILGGLVFKRKARRGISWELIAIADWRMGQECCTRHHSYAVGPFASCAQYH
jgi:hypothetical protein